MMAFLIGVVCSGKFKSPPPPAVLSLFVLSTRVSACAVTPVAHILDMIQEVVAVAPLQERYKLNSAAKTRCLWIAEAAEHRLAFI